MSEQEIIDICNFKINKKLLKSPTHTIFVDGTSCTKKSTILSKTGIETTKVQYHANTKNPDTYFPSLIGYIATGINNQNCGKPHFNDRSPLNVLEWRILWKIMDNYMKTIGNKRPNLKIPKIFELFDNYKNIFLSLKNSYYYQYFRSKINGIAFIDSNVERCDELRCLRNENTDLQRSQWLFYTDLQNLMYKTLYPETYIDMAWFNTNNTDIVVDGIAKWLVNLLDEITNRNIQITQPPICKFKLPTIKYDYNLSNINAHIYRSVGRNGCKRIVNSDDNIICTKSIPGYLNVKNFDTPDNTLYSINAVDFENLIDKRQFYYNDNSENDKFNESTIIEDSLDISDMFE